MEPITPPPPQSDAAKGYNLLMGTISSIFELLRTFNKRPFPATEDQVKGLVKLAERDRPLLVKVETEAVVQQLAGRVQELNKEHVATMEQLSERFAKNGNLLGQIVDNQTVILKNELELGVKAVKAATVDMNAGAARISSKITVDFAQGWRWVAGLVLGPVAFLLLGMGFAGQFSKVSKSDFEQLQKQLQQSLAKQQVSEGSESRILASETYYFAQIKKYKAKNPNTKDFPAYERAK